MNENDVPDFMKEEWQKVPEAVASVTYKIVSPNGFPSMLTIRASDANELLNRMAVIEGELLSSGIVPDGGQKPVSSQPKPSQPVQTPAQPKPANAWAQTHQFSVPQAQQTKMCPKCGGKLEEKVSKAGKKFLKCENGKWDFMKKQATGCDYIDWLDKTPSGKPATPKQMEIIQNKWPQFFRADLTFDEASEIISSNFVK